MTVLHLPLEIDPEVHPELYAMLVSLRTDAARAERLRQLAGTGLIWETVRQHGYPKTLQAPPPEPLPPESFVDLSIDAPKPPADAPAAGPDFEREVEIAVRELPILHDVIEPASEPAPALEPAPAIDDVVVPMTRPATRARLQRMKDKGLFKNG